MLRIRLILLILLALIALAAVGIAIYFRMNPASPLDIGNQNPTNKIEVKPAPTPEQLAAQIKKDYPEDIKGVINFLDAKDFYSATIKTDDGKQYTLYPPQPASIYESFGAKNGQRVQVQGRFTKDGNLEWAALKPI